MDDGVDAWALLIKNAVHIILAGGLGVSVHLFPVRREDHHVLRLCEEIIHSRGADGHEVFLGAVDAQVAEGAHCQPQLYHLFAVLYDLFPFFL